MAENSPQTMNLLKTPVRMCVICRQRFEKGKLKRHIIGANGAFVQDEHMTAPGRGWYCCLNPRCIGKFAGFKPNKKRVSSKNAAAR